jgi:hypothetical protein
MNVYTHTDLAEKACAIAKLPSFEKHPAATSVLDAPASSQSDLQQRYSSSREAEIDIQRQPLSTVEKKDDRRALKSSGRKALPEKTLSTDDEECHRMSEVHLDGLEPSTFGSVDDSQKRGKTLFLRCLSAFCAGKLLAKYSKQLQKLQGFCVPTPFGVVTTPFRINKRLRRTLKGGHFRPSYRRRDSGSNRSTGRFIF